MSECQCEVLRAEVARLRNALSGIRARLVWAKDKDLTDSGLSTIERVCVQVYRTADHALQETRHE